MSIYSELLSSFISDGHDTQVGLAEKIGKSQVAVHRYANGARFPDSDTARAIDAATGGAVPFSKWREEAAARLGLDAAA